MWAASCATSSRWALRPIALLDSLRFGPLTDPTQPPPSFRAWSSGHRRLRQLPRRAHGGRRGPFDESYSRQPARQRDVRGRRSNGSSCARRAPLAPGTRSSWSAPTPAATAFTARRWLRSNSMKLGRAPPRGAGGQSLPREAADGGLRRAGGGARRLDRRAAGPRRGGPDSSSWSKSAARRDRDRDRRRARAASRGGDDRLRGHALANRRSACCRSRSASTSTRCLHCSVAGRLHCDVIGHVTDDHVVRIFDGDEDVVRVPATTFTDAPEYRRQGVKPKGLDELQTYDLAFLPDIVAWDEGPPMPMRPCCSCSPRRRSRTSAGSGASTTTRC